jgi:hypothetical protein
LCSKGEGRSRRKKVQFQGGLNSRKTRVLGGKTRKSAIWKVLTFQMALKNYTKNKGEFRRCYSRTQKKT